MIARALIFLGLVLLAIDTARLTITGVALLGAVLIAVGLILAGALTRGFWVADEPADAPASRLDVLDGRGLR